MQSIDTNFLQCSPTSEKGRDYAAQNITHRRSISSPTAPSYQKSPKKSMFSLLLYPAAQKLGFHDLNMNIPQLSARLPSPLTDGIQSAPLPNVASPVSGNVNTSEMPLEYSDQSDSAANENSEERVESFKNRLVGEIVSLKGSYGFIGSGESMIFFHYSELTFYPFLGDTVEFSIEYDDKTAKMKAMNLVYVDCTNPISKQDQGRVDAEEYESPQQRLSNVSERSDEKNESGAEHVRSISLNSQSVGVDDLPKDALAQLPPSESNISSQEVRNIDSRREKDRERGKRDKGDTIFYKQMMKSPSISRPPFSTPPPSTSSFNNRHPSPFTAPSPSAFSNVRPSIPTVYSPTALSRLPFTPSVKGRPLSASSASQSIPYASPAGSYTLAESPMTIDFSHAMSQSMPIEQEIRLLGVVVSKSFEEGYIAN